MSPRRGPAIAILIARAVIFVVLLEALIIRYRSFPIPGWILSCIAILTVVFIAVIGLKSAKVKRRRRLDMVRTKFPGSVVIRTDWNSALLPDFVSDRARVLGADVRGFGVDIAVDSVGLHLFRGTSKSLVHLGDIDWSELDDVTTRRDGRILRITANVTSPISSPVELIVRGESATQAAERILTVQRGIP